MTENTKQYRLLNYGLLSMFISILMYPIIALTFRLNIKTCNGYCPSCGMTRDIYNMLTFQTHVKLLNPKSHIFFALILSLIVSRIVIAQLIFYNLRFTAIADILFTTIIFISLFLLINKI